MSGRKAWLEAYRNSDSLYTQAECGCLVLILADMPDVIKDSRNEILRESLAGRALKRAHPRSTLPPAECAEHRRERATA